jgi:hypothetical protein
LPSFASPLPRVCSLPVLLWVMVVCWSRASSAHGPIGEPKPARVEYEYFPQASVSSAGSSPLAARFQVARIGLTLPVPVSRSTLLLPALRYQVLDIGAEGARLPAERDPVEALHSLQLSLGTLVQLGEHWRLLGQLGGGVAGDLAVRLSADDWVLSASLLALWTAGSGFTLGAGVGYDRRTGDVAPLPLIGVYWELSPHILVRGVLPQSVSLRYRPEQHITLALDGGLDGERYHLSRARVAVDHAEVAYSVVKLGPSATLALERLAAHALDRGTRLAPAFRPLQRRSPTRRLRREVRVIRRLGDVVRPQRLERGRGRCRIGRGPCS